MAKCTHAFGCSVIDPEFEGRAMGQAFYLSPDGKYLYNLLVLVYAVESDGTLTEQCIQLNGSAYGTFYDFKV